MPAKMARDLKKRTEMKKLIIATKNQGKIKEISQRFKS